MELLLYSCRKETWIWGYYHGNNVIFCFVFFCVLVCGASDTSYATLSRGILWNIPRDTWFTWAFRRVCISRNYERLVGYSVEYQERALHIYLTPCNSGQHNQCDIRMTHNRKVGCYTVECKMAFLYWLVVFCMTWYKCKVRNATKEVTCAQVVLLFLVMENKNAWSQVTLAHLVLLSVNRYGLPRKMVVNRKATEQVQWRSLAVHPSVLWVSWLVLKRCLMSRVIHRTRHVFTCALKHSRDWRQTLLCLPRNVITDCS